MNFIWNAYEFIWKIRLDELKEFHRERGNCIVPVSFEHFPRLGSWVKEVRRRKKNQEKETPSSKAGFLAKKQIEELNCLNFVWDADEARFLEKFNVMPALQRPIVPISNCCIEHAHR